MESVAKILVDKYGIDAGNNYINGAEFITCFNVDIDIDDEETSIIKNGKTYITYDFCKEIIITHKIEEFLKVINKLFKCDKCDKLFKTKRNLNYHIQKVTSCESLFCKQCNVMCKNKSILKQHKKTKTHIANMKNNINTINSNGDNNINNINGTINNTTNNITNNIGNITCLLCYTDPKNIQNLSEKDILSIMSGPTYKIIPESVVLTHFNKQHPESHNIRHTNKQSKNVLVYENDKWNTEKSCDVANYLMKLHNAQSLTELLEKCKDKLSIEQINEIKKYIIDITLPLDSNGKISFPDREACDDFFRREKNTITRIINTLYDETQRLKLKNPLKQ